MFFYKRSVIFFALIIGILISAPVSHALVRAFRSPFRNPQSKAARWPHVPAAFDRPLRRTSYADQRLRRTQMVFGMDVDGMKPGQPLSVDDSAIGYPVRSLSDVPAGEYYVQAVLHRYETFHPLRRPHRQAADGPRRRAALEPRAGQSLLRRRGRSRLGTAAAPSRSCSIKRSRRSPRRRTRSTSGTCSIQSELLTKFWGRAMFLGAHVLVPEGFDEHPDARYPLIIYHGHFPPTSTASATTPPDPNLKPDYSERFHLAGYNRIQQEDGLPVLQAVDRARTSRVVLAVEIQHANPYYDDSYAVNSANLGPYGDAIEKELIPAIEKQFRGIGAGLGALRLRRLDRRLGSDGRADVLSRPLQRRVRRLPGSDRLPRLHRRQHLRGHERVLHRGPVHKRCRSPRMRNYLGHAEHDARADEPAANLRSAPRRRSGEQCDIWQAVYSPGRRRWISEADLRQAHRRDRPDGRRRTGGSTTT